LIQYLEKYVKPIGKPMDLVKIFNGLTNSQRRHLKNGLRLLFNFYEAQGLADKEFLDILRKNLPKTNIGVDLRVPTEKEIVNSLKTLSEKDKTKRYFALYSLLLDSGLRLSEAVTIYNRFVTNKIRLEEHNGFYLIPLSLIRNTKQAYYCLLTDYTVAFLKRVDSPLIYWKLRGLPSKKFGVVNWKYLRKFVYSKMIELGVPESIADFIQGRVPKTIGARHYMNLRQKALQFYPRYTKYLQELRSKNLNNSLPLEHNTELDRELNSKIGKGFPI